MKNVLRLVGLFAFLAVLPTAHAADLTGTWKGAFDFQGTSVPLTFHLTVAGGGVTGTVEGLPTTPVEIHEGKVDGDTVTFWVNSDYQGTTYKLVYDGKVDGDTVTFSVTTDYQGSPVKLVYKGKISADEIKFAFGTEDGSWGTE